MDRPDSPEKALRVEIARLGQELEQTHVALEDAHAEIAALAGEQDGLRREVTRLTRQHSAETARLVADAQQHKCTTGKLRAALEESSVLAEELQAANEELHAANEVLDQRVAERTAELGQANAELELVNADLHRRVEAETAARVKAQAELFQMQKLEAIGQLTGGIAHDFNNLLMVIINGLQVLAQSGDVRLRERALRRTQEASWRASELTRRLLAFARRQALHPERVDLPQHVEALRELLGQGVRENIQLNITVAEDVWPLEADLGALELALLNLAVNARDAMPDGGNLTIAVRNVLMDAVIAVRHAVAPGEYVQIAVEDTGTGMAPEILEKVFEPFFTTKGAGRGTGLGLAQVYGFAQQSKGTAWVDSRLGEGTIVRVLLPRSQRKVRREPVQPHAVSNAQPRGELRVLVVEDEPAVADAVLDMLTELGHRGTCVATVAAALALLAEAKRPDIVLSDVLLPGGGSGLDLAREIQQRQLSVPIILTSGYGGAMTQRLSTMNVPFLRKPYRMETLRHAIDTALQTPTPDQQLSNAVARG
ncbi:MAG: ATP-binding protein [Acetobacteraceae bacterium]|jgi:signal transduction histidine kinase/ActR/RegA family two-component response regulator